jgi:hypothetical protein
MADGTKRKGGKMLDGDEAPAPRKDIWDIAKIVAGSIFVPLAAAWLAVSVNNSIRERDVRVRMVELAIDILKAPALTTRSDAALRSWATRLVNTYSGVPLVEERPAGVVAATNTHISAATFAGYAHVNVRSNPPGAEVLFTPSDYPEVSIPAPGVTPTENQPAGGKLLDYVEEGCAREERRRIDNVQRKQYGLRGLKVADNRSSA